MAKRKRIGVKGWLIRKQGSESLYMVEGCADTVPDAGKLMRWVMLRERFRFVPETAMQRHERKMQRLETELAELRKIKTKARKRV